MSGYFQWPKPDVEAGDLLVIRGLDGVEHLFLIMSREDVGPNEFDLELLPDWEPAPDA